MSSRFLTYDSVVRDICAANGDVEAKTKYVIVARLLKHALNDLNLLAMPRIKSVAFEVNLGMCIVLPEDAIVPQRVGWVHDNRIIMLSNDHSIRRMDAPEPGCSCSSNTAPSAIADYGVMCPVHHFWFQSNWAYGEQYGVQHETNVGGYYRWNPALRRIELQGGVIAPGDRLLVEYKSSSESDLLIPSEAFNVLLYSVTEKMNVNSPHISTTNRRNMAVEWERLVNLYNSQSAEDIVSAILSGRRAAPR